jgi:hypothetical protein
MSSTVCFFLEVLPCSVEFEFPGRLEIPLGAETNVFRGALGYACPEIFSSQGVHGPSGYADSPRPLRLRFSHLSFQAMERTLLGFDVLLFVPKIALVSSLFHGLQESLKGVSDQRGDSPAGFHSRSEENPGPMIRNRPLARA